jgi:hypothetical protein
VEREQVKKQETGNKTDREGIPRPIPYIYLLSSVNALPEGNSTLKVRSVVCGYRHLRSLKGIVLARGYMAMNREHLILKAHETG